MASRVSATRPCGHARTTHAAMHDAHAHEPRSRTTHMRMTITTTTPRRSAAREPVGRHGAAGRCWRFRRSSSAADHRAAAVRRRLRRFDLRDRAPRRTARDRRERSTAGSHSALHALHEPLFWLAAAGVLSAWSLYIKWPHLPDVIDAKLKPLHRCSSNKYYFDWFNENVLAARQPLVRHAFLEGRRQGASSTARRQRLGRLGRLVRRHRAPRAERLPVFLCLLDGHRSGRDARLVPATRLTKNETHMQGLSDSIASDLAAHRGRHRRAVDRRSRIEAGRWVALVTVARRCSCASIPLYTGFDGATAATSSSSSCRGSRRFNVDYYLGVDGISMPLILLTTFITVR